MTQSLERDPSVAHREHLASLSARLRAPLVQFFERRVGNTAEAEDLAQEVFERLTRQKDLGSLDHLDGYVFTVAVNLLRDRARREAAQGAVNHVSLEHVAHLSEEITPERVLIGEDAMNRFLAALAELPERTRTVVMLRRYEALEFKEIARRLGISVSAVEKHMLRAMDHLSQRLDLK